MSRQEKVVDVLVAGGGPAGAAAARHCAGAGLSTLVLERRKLPRDKVCSGMLMGRWACELVEGVFGPLPDEVLAAPKVLVGHKIHVAGAEPVAFGMRTPIAWRKHLDGWMVRRARDEGAEFWESSHVVEMSPEGGRYRAKVVRAREEVVVSAGYLIGAEGAASPTRKALFPDLQVRYSKPLREIYPGSLALEPDYYHWFFPKGQMRPRFGVNHKDDVFMIEGRDILDLREDIRRILGPANFAPGSRPVLRDGCMIAVLHNELLSGRFRPGVGNCLLVGDAAGLILPITFEGISTAVWSGTLAGEAVLEAASGKGTAMDGYGERLRPVLAMIERFKGLEAGLTAREAQGPAPLAEALAEAYQAAES
ncbi:MAG: NAD(P)/FAD-dependent oxidoreductase [Deltaproteobacteria bacterium]|nr:NAD(P)/FAD-dependent oxidoreductase [Deltaproteobacteria bacterium]